MHKRIWSVQVLNVDETKATLTVWRKKHEAGKTTYFLFTFLVPKETKMKSINGRAIKFFDIKSGSTVTMDYLKEKGGRLIALAIILADKIFFEAEVQKGGD